MKILSIDPGYEKLGIAILEKEGAGTKEKLIFSMCFKTNPKISIHERVFLIGKKIEETIDEYGPEALAIENLFFENNQKTAMSVAETRGVIIYEAKKNNLLIYEYTPLQVKSAITGYGKATKENVFFMVKKLINMPEKKTVDDEIDAIAIGLTCFASERFFHKPKTVENPLPE